MQNSKSFNRDIQLKSFPLIGQIIGKLSLKEIIIFDLETTTFLNQKSSGITEIALLKILRNGDSCCVSTLVNPENPISLFVSNLTGITSDHVAQENNWPAFIKKVGHHWMKSTLSGFNIDRFDIPYIEHQNGRYELNHSINKVTIDIRGICQSIHKTNKGTLEFYCNHYGVDVSGAHRAKQDTLLTARLFENMIERHGINMIIENIVGFEARED